MHEIPGHQNPNVLLSHHENLRFTGECVYYVVLLFYFCSDCQSICVVCSEKSKNNKICFVMWKCFSYPHNKMYKQRSVEGKKHHTHTHTPGENVTEHWKESASSCLKKVSIGFSWAALSIECQSNIWNRYRKTTNKVTIGIIKMSSFFFFFIMFFITTT